MPRSHETGDHDFRPFDSYRTRLKRLAISLSVLAFGLLIVFLMLWNTFFVYVPPGKYLVIKANSGAEMAPGQVLAKPGQKGMQEEVLGEGWHFIMPFVYS